MDAANTGERPHGSPSEQMNPNAHNQDQDPINARGRTRTRDEDVEDEADLKGPAIALTESHLRVPAWTRVKTAARPHRTVRHIMRRIGTLALKFTKKKKRQTKETQDDRCELPRARHQRTQAFKPCQDDWQTVGLPQSKAEMACQVMSAKVDIANRVLELPAEAFVAEVDDLLNSVHTKVVPAKRGIDRHYRLEQVGIVGGHRLKSYNMIWPILVKGAEMAGRRIDIQAAAFAQLAAHLQEARPDPRVPIAGTGRPDLSDIADVTEPESFMALMRAPEGTALATSPTKRPAQPITPIMARPARLSETKIELLPAPTPITESSPVKSSPLPASFADTPSPRRIVATSPSLETFATGCSVRVAPGQMPSSPLRPNTAPRSFQVPSDDDSTTLTPKAHAATGVFMASSYDDSTSSAGINTSNERADAQAGDQLALNPRPDTSKVFQVPSDAESTLSSDTNSFQYAQDQAGHGSIMSAKTGNSPQASKVASADAFGSSPAHAGKETLSAPSSPINFSRPFPSTPVGRYQLESTTPHESVPMPSSPTPGLTQSKKSLLEAMPPFTPRLPVSELGGMDTNKDTKFDFGTTSASFNSPSSILPSWANPHLAAEAQKKLRRKSEPLFRTFFKGRAAAHLSASPKKVTFRDLVDQSTPGSLRADSFPYEPNAENAIARQQQNLLTPEITISPAAAVGGAATPAISWAYMTGRAASDTIGQRTPQAMDQVNDRESVLSVDMHRNLNIFGGEEVSPFKRRATAIDQLARIAEANCDGQAKVVVTQEHARFFVRFKLPTKFAFMFPPAQGFDESRFTTTPSISSSPRIRVPGPYPSVEGAVSSPHPSPMRYLSVEGAVSSPHPSPMRYLSVEGAFSSPQPSPLRTPAIAPAHHDNTMVCDGFAPSPSGFRTGPAFAHGQDSFSLSIDATANYHVDEHSTTIPWRQSSDLHLDSLVAGANAPHPAHHDPMEESDSSLTELMSLDVEMTPAGEDHDMDYAAHERMSAQSDVEMSDLAPAKEEYTTANPTGMIIGDQRISPSYKLSPWYMGIPTMQTSDDDYGWDDVRRLGQNHVVRDHDNHSPGREYMRGFINRARPKRLSATETGSPIVLPTRRPPLGAKDPNTESPLLGKRKAQVERQEARSPFKRGAAPVLKHQWFEASMASHGEQDHEMQDTEPKRLMRGGENVAAFQSDEEMTDAPAMRRSSRLRTLRKPKTAPKSSIPTPIKVSSRAGSGRGHPPKPKSRSVQHELSQQTRINTRKNKGNAEYPSQMLARLSIHEMEVDTQANHFSKATKSSRDTKSVGWREPLVSHQDEPPKRGRRAKIKPKATQGQTGVEKLQRQDAAARKKRTAQVATNLGLPAMDLGLPVNGAPARPGRITRAAARAQQ
ncbi:hypothetical protein HRG_000438 [Hirsutella rhossiliensis]|uniref:Uncharacterized protein n=1 Tax=Hirsutella rhossiliensis TaxID=111463 RepID=A0A9P8N890_9HYPO|nr:uncharacterized protein HRG_00438 [Hirsutella rhossiliensis]KAH0967796.1 hypothetical protein HRG_00438 [Hirsutella rhossiliensis]